MPLNTRIEDGEGTGREVGVTSLNALKVAVLNTPTVDIPEEQLTVLKALRAFLKDSGGSIDMNADGSVTPIEFTIGAVPGLTRFVTSVRFLFNGTNLEMDTADFRRFGQATAVNTALTNGVEFFVEQGGVTTEFFVTPVGTMGQFFDFSDEFLNIPNSISTSSDFLRFDFNFDEPVVLPPATVDRIVVRVNDDLTGLDRYNAFVSGYQEVV